MRDKLGASATASTSGSTTNANVNVALINTGMIQTQSQTQSAAQSQNPNGDSSNAKFNVNVTSSNLRVETQKQTEKHNGTNHSPNQNQNLNGDPSPKVKEKTKSSVRSKCGFMLTSNSNSATVSAGNGSGLVNTVKYNNRNGSHSHSADKKQPKHDGNSDTTGSDVDNHIAVNQNQKRNQRRNQSQNHNQDNSKSVEHLGELKLAEFRRALLRAQPLSNIASNSKRSKDVALIHRTLKLHLEICTHLIYDFNDPTVQVDEKDAKRMILIGLVEYISIQNTTAPIPEKYFADIVKLISANLFRSLPPKPEGGLLEMLEDEDPKPEKSWAHLQIVYEILNRFILCASVDARVAKKYITQKFISNLMSLFESDDTREREYLKTVLHRIYAKFMVHRAFIRGCIKNMFLTVTYEDVNTYNGIAEVLEILASIINGFALPLKKEHIDSLTNVLVPLHKVKGLVLFHRQLSYCICQYVEKDKSTAEAIVKGIIKLWPVTNSSKQVFFLHELEDILEITLREPVFAYYMVPFVEQVARCLDSPHFQVVEKILFIFQNDYLCKLIAAKNRNLISLLIRKLQRVSNTHWNPLIIKMSSETMNFLKDLDAKQKSYSNDENQVDRDYAEASNTNELLRRWDSLTNSMK